MRKLLRNLNRRCSEWARVRCWRIVRNRYPDKIIGTEADPYLLRWYITPWRHSLSRLDDIPAEQRTRRQRVAHLLLELLPNVYLHVFMRPDDDRALHDHPWPWASWLLQGSYIEHTIDAGGIHRRTRRWEGSFRVRGPRSAHRVELDASEVPEVVITQGKRQFVGRFHSCMTIFITGPRVREWGFHCPETGWKHWRDFTDPATAGATVGKGCDA
jgi:hypothetical protein